MPSPRVLLRFLVCAPVLMAASLAPYLIVFDDAGRPIASSARLAGAPPVPPPGVFDYTRAAGEDRITWQPSLRSEQSRATAFAAWPFSPCVLRWGMRW